MALVSALAKLWDEDGDAYLTARSEKDGEAVCETLRAEGLRVDWLRFDLFDPESLFVLAETLCRRHGGGDIATLNGAYAPRAGVPAAEDARPMIEANNYGTLRFLKAFRPVLNDNARMVIVASGFGTLASLSENLRPRFETKRHSSEEVDAVMSGYVRSAEAGTAAAEGWPDWVNVPSKVGQVAVTRAFAREFGEAARSQGILLNAAQRASHY